MTTSPAPAPGPTAVSPAATGHWCATCGSEATFEQPDCPDEHGGDCPEWVCVRCGEAFLIGFALPDRRSA